MDRIIEVKITGCHLTKSSNLAGVAGEASVTALRIEFDESWDGYAKTITWLNASGETATGFILTVDMLEDTIKSTRVYIAPIPKAALTLAGETLFSVDGYMNGKRQRSVYGKLIVRQGGEFEAIDDVDSTTAEKIQSQLEGRLEEIQSALAGAEQAQAESAKSAETAGEYMGKAQEALAGAEQAQAESAKSAAFAKEYMESTEAARDESVQSAASAKEYMESTEAAKDEFFEKGPNIRKNPDATDGDIIDTHLTVGNRTGTVGANSFVSGGAENGPNTASGEFSFVGGGCDNAASGKYSLVGGGYTNKAQEGAGFIGGGWENTVKGKAGFIGGGHGNNASAESAFVGGGWNNTANGNSAFIGGGAQNGAKNDFTFVGGGFGNFALGYAAFTGGGVGNQATSTAESAFVGGGTNNRATGKHSFVGGGRNNTVSGESSFIGGGCFNTARAHQVKFGHYSETGSAGKEVGTTGDALIIGNGKSESNRSNAMRVTYGGEIYTSAGYGTEEKKVAIEEYVNDAEKRLVEQISVIDENGEKLENKGVPNGYAPLDEAGKIPNGYLYQDEYIYHTYGVSIDLSNDNPETAVTYINDAIGMVAGSPDWYKMSIFNKIKPCLFKNGAVVGYLNPDNFAQFEDGSAADITSGDAGDVMIEIPKMGYKISKSGKNLTVQITDYPDRKDFCYKAHTRTEDGDRDKLYIGAFLGSNVSGKLRSLSGRLPQTNISLITGRSQAHANGKGYDLLSFYPLTLLQCLYLINYKNLNSQAALGMGCVNNDTYKKTGATIDRGMSYGTSDRTEQVKFLGIEDFWGNLYQWIDGIDFINGTPIVATDGFSSTGGFDGKVTYLNRLHAESVAGFMKEPQGNNELGFVIGTAGGSNSTHFSDYGYYNSGRAIYGGCYKGDVATGIFRLQIGFQTGTGHFNVGSRLMFL